MRRALRRYREYSLFLEKYSVGEKTAENNNGLNPKKPLFFGKTGCGGGAAGMPQSAALPRLRTRRNVNKKYLFTENFYAAFSFHACKDQFRISAVPKIVLANLNCKSVF